MNEIKIVNPFEKFGNGIERTKPISEIVIHGTAGFKSAQKLLEWIEDGERAKEYKEGIALFHFLIDTNGDIYQTLDPSRWCYHSSSGKHDEVTIGIEHINNKRDNSASYTPHQYQSSRDLILKLVVEYIDIVSIVGHSYNLKTYSHRDPIVPCPGNYDFQALQMALGNDYIYDHRIPKMINRSFTP